MGYKNSNKTILCIETRRYQFLLATSLDTAKGGMLYGNQCYHTTRMLVKAWFKNHLFLQQEFARESKKVSSY